MAPTKKRKNCSGTKGYNCGQSCISVKYACIKDGLSGQAVTLANKHMDMVKSVMKGGDISIDDLQGAVHPDVEGKDISIDELDNTPDISSKPKKVDTTPDTTGMKVLGKGMTGTAYSNGKGEVIKVEKMDLETLGEGDLDKYVNSLKKASTINNQMASLGIAPKIKSIEEKDGEIYTVMEELEGYQTLDSLSSEQQDSMNKNRLKEIKDQMEAFGIIHNDLHPGNVMVNPETNDIKLIDFDYAEEKFYKMGHERDWDGMSFYLP